MPIGSRPRYSRLAGDLRTVLSQPEAVEHMVMAASRNGRTVLDDLMLPVLRLAQVRPWQYTYAKLSPLLSA